MTPVGEGASLCLRGFLGTSEPGNIDEQPNPTWPQHGRCAVRGLCESQSGAMRPTSPVFSHLHPTASYVQTRTWPAFPMLHGRDRAFLSLHRDPFSLLPNSALCEALFWVASTRPPGSAAITLSRSSAPHLPMPSPPPARAPSMVAPSQSVPSSSFPSCPSTRMPPPPRTPSPPVSRSLAAFPGALAEPP